MPWPLTISSVTVIDSVARPGDSASTVMPSASVARSFANISAAPPSTTMPEPYGPKRSTAARSASRMPG